MRQCSYCGKLKDDVKVNEFNKLCCVECNYKIPRSRPLLFNHDIGNM